MITRADIRRGYQVLGHLMTVNIGMGHAIRRMHEYEARHGHLPAHELRELGGLLHEIGDELTDYARVLDHPVIDIP